MRFFNFLFYLLNLLKPEEADWSCGTYAYHIRFKYCGVDKFLWHKKLKRTQLYSKKVIKL